MKNSITVYYASPDNLQETQDWSILYKEPKSLNSYLTKNLKKDRDDRNKFSVATYNILSPIYAEKWNEKEEWEWSNRRSKETSSCTSKSDSG